MSAEPSQRRAPHLAAMFQKAYAQAVMLQSADEQISSMIQQRERLEAEIRQVQGEIHEEFERVLNAAKSARMRLDAQIAENIKPTVELPRMKIAPANAQAGGRPKIVVAS